MDWKQNEHTSEEILAALPEPLLRWYRDNARDLPWRHTDDPYRIWVSEIMLQQTRVAAVLGYYARFLAALPSVVALAAAPGMSLVAGERRMRKHIAVIWRLVGSFICPPPRTARRRTRAC